jgi:hypothetical protein
MSRPDADDPRWAWKEYADELQAELEAEKNTRVAWQQRAWIAEDKLAAAIKGGEDETH